MSIDYFEASELARWFADDGDNTHRVDYALGPDSVVFDLGGYHGEWARKITERYGCAVYVFEPVRSHFDKIVEDMRSIPAIIPRRFALAERDGKSTIRHNMDSSSVHLSSGFQEEIDLVEIGSFMESEGIELVDLMKVNIEGCEYDLLEHMLAKSIHEKVQDMQIQFHKMFPDSETRRERIRTGLSRTHHLTYDYRFVWENWRKKS